MTYLTVTDLEGPIPCGLIQCFQFDICAFADKQPCESLQIKPDETAPFPNQQLSKKPLPPKCLAS